MYHSKKLLEINLAITILVSLVPEAVQPRFGEVRFARTVQELVHHLLKLIVINEAGLVQIKVVKLHLHLVQIQAGAVKLLGQV